jgi:hypothetical protein
MTSMTSIMEGLTKRALAEGVSFLEGYKVNLQKFKSSMPGLVQAGIVKQEDANYVLHGLEWGFDMGLDESKMPGKIVYKNYRSAFENKEKVTAALAKRVATGKTLKLGAFDGDPKKLPGETATVVPNGAVGKKLEPDAVRPFSDHTKSRFNGAVDAERVKHTLDTYNEIARELRPGYFMRVEDVDAAFPVLPLAPRVWKYMYVWWYDVDAPLEAQTKPNTLYVHVFADFGAAPMPGIWNLFFRCLKGMAQQDGVLTLPMPHYVDDNGIIGPTREEVDSVAERLADYVEDCGSPFKRLKSRHAAIPQLMLGFWWDSVERTRTLEEHKLTIYLDYLLTMSRRRVMLLSEMQVLAGRMYRASLTMPAGSRVFLAEIISMMRGLKMPWHRRRVTMAARRDMLALHEILTSNHGRGYFDWEHLPWAEAVYSDAMKDSSTAGWGWCTQSGKHDSGVYGRSMRRKPIDELEADAVYRAAEALGDMWRGKRVPLYIDNSAVQLSLRKGWSRAPRLTSYIKKLHQLAVHYDCVLVLIWISTHDNIGADALSRNDYARYAQWACNL